MGRKSELVNVLTQWGYSYVAISKESILQVHGLYLRDEIFSPRILSEYTYLGIYYQEKAQYSLALTTFQQGKDAGCPYCAANYLSCWVESSANGICQTQLPPNLIQEYSAWAPSPPNLIKEYSALCNGDLCIIRDQTYRYSKFFLTKKPTFLRMIELAEQMTHVDPCNCVGRIHVEAAKAYLKYEPLNLDQSTYHWERSCRGKYGWAMNQYATHLMKDPSTEAYGVYYFTQAYSLGCENSAEHLITYFYKKSRYSMMLDLCTELLEGKKAELTVHNYLSYYYATVVIDPVKMLYHGEQSIEQSRVHLVNWYSQNVSLDGLRFSLRYQTPDLRDICLEKLPITEEYIHLLLSIATNLLSSINQTLKRIHLKNCVEFYWHAPTYFSSPRHCVRDILEMVKKYLN